MSRQNHPQNHPKASLPIWVWPFAVTCFAIPVISVGGAIPTGLGVGAGFYCLAVAREGNKTTHRKLFHCGAAMAAAWTLFLVVAGGAAVLQDKVFSPKAAQHHEEQFADTDGVAPNTTRTASVRENSSESASPGDAKQREIYAKAVSMRDDIKDAEQRERDFRAKGMGEVAHKQVVHIKGMHESRQEFYAEFYDISRAELDEIIARGDRENWPHD